MHISYIPGKNFIFSMYVQRIKWKLKRKVLFTSLKREAQKRLKFGFSWNEILGNGAVADFYGFLRAFYQGIFPRNPMHLL